MKKVLVLGAKLQGTEIIYLAKKAGYYVTVIDRNPSAPGADLADKYVKADIMNEKSVIKYFQDADAVIPAIENIDVLEQALKYGEKVSTKVLFDIDAYRISSSKNRSNKLFDELNIPVPQYYPDCDYPVIVKPDGMSGSAGVIKLDSKEKAEEYLKEHGTDNTVIQEFLDGRSYSLEVIGDGERFYFPQITEVVVDDNYDCKRIIAPAKVTEDIKKQMYAIGHTLAKKLKIKGIFDIEVIEHKGILKILEIDARFPSQTPISIYNSTGINMVQLMTELLVDGRYLEEVNDIKTAEDKQDCCIYQQIVVSQTDIQVLGEHIISECSRLRRLDDFYGADEVMTDFYNQTGNEWKAIVIITRSSEEEAFEAFEKFLTNISNLDSHNYKYMKSHKYDTEGVMDNDKVSA